MKKIIPILSLLFLLAACQTPFPSEPSQPSNSSACARLSSYMETGYVYDVVDGDTIRVVINGERYPVRLVGIDAPEHDEPLYYSSTVFLEGLVLDKTVELLRDKSDTDKYDRLLRYVIVDDVFVNYEIVANGFALNKDYYPDTRCSQEFSEANTIARENSRGIYK